MNSTTLRRWPLLVIAAPAAVATWSGWVGLAEQVGFGPVRPLPGIIDGFTINSALTLPIGVEAYAAAALYVWIAGAARRPAARRFAAVSGVGALLLGMFGQVAYHLLTVAGYSRAPWPIVTAVSCLPVAVLGAAAALWHLLAADRRAADVGPSVDRSAGPVYGLASVRMTRTMLAAADRPGMRSLLPADHAAVRRADQSAEQTAVNAAKLPKLPAADRSEPVDVPAAGPVRTGIPEVAAHYLNRYLAIAALRVRAVYEQGGDRSALADVITECDGGGKPEYRPIAENIAASLVVLRDGAGRPAETDGDEQQDETRTDDADREAPGGGLFTGRRLGVVRPTADATDHAAGKIADRTDRADQDPPAYDIDALADFSGPALSGPPLGARLAPIVGDPDKADLIVTTANRLIGGGQNITRSALREAGISLGNGEMTHVLRVLRAAFSRQLSEDTEDVPAAAV